MVPNPGPHTPPPRPPSGPHPPSWLLLCQVWLFLSVQLDLTRACFSSGSSSIIVTGASGGTDVPAHWGAAVTVTGGSAVALWSLAGLSSTSGVLVAPGGHANISCLTLTGAALVLPSAASFGQPLALQAPLVANHMPLLELHQVTIVTDCAAVRQHQQFLCSLNVAYLNGTFEVSSPYWIFVHYWISSTLVLTDVNITCSPPTPAAAVPPLCLATTVSDGTAMLAAIDQLQRQQGPPLHQPLAVLVLLNSNIALAAEDVSPWWPLGLDITARVTIAAPAWLSVVLDWHNLINVLNVRGNAGSYLTLSSLTMINMPISYAPPATGNAHLFGILGTTLNPVLRMSPSVLTIQSCTYVLSWDIFAYWAFWLSLATSPTASVSQLASWTKFSPLRASSSDPNRLRLTDTVSFSSLWINLTLANPSVHPRGVLINDTGFVDITNIDGVQTFVPPTAFFTVKSLADMVYGVNATIGNFWNRQFGQIILLCANVSGLTPASATNSTLFPSPAHADAASNPSPAAMLAGSDGDMFGQAVGSPTVVPPAPPPPPVLRLPLGNVSTPAMLQVPTTMTTWPRASVCWDVQQMHLLFVLTVSAQLTIRGLSLVNLPWSMSAFNASADPIMRLVLGFWHMPQRQPTGSTSMSTFLTLSSVSVYVPPAELQLLFGAASLQQPDAPTDALSLSSAGRAIMARFIVQQEIADFGSTWIFYSTFVTLRFVGTNINVSSTVPLACSDFAALPISNLYSAFTGVSASTARASSRPSGGLSVWAVGLIAGLCGGTALAAALGVLLVASAHRRAAKRAGSQARTSASSRHLKAGHHDDGAGMSVYLGDESVHSKKVISMIDSFSCSPSEASGPTMIDDISNPSQRNSVVSVGRRVDPEALISRLTLQNTGVRDEQLQILSVLGRGGHGIVYRGLWKGLPVAAKVMIVHEERHEQARRQMLEATLSTSLSHPNIVTTYSYDLQRLSTTRSNSMVFTSVSARVSAAGRADISPQGSVAALDFVGATAWQLLIVQELCTGGTLRQMVDDNNLARHEICENGVHSPNMEHVLQLALDVALGLEHLHSKNVVHSDMTPNNVLLQAVTEPRAAGLLWIAKIADFGLSVAFEEGKSHVSKMFAGTPYYIAPETQNEGIISKASDVFALGILLFEMVSGPMAIRKGATTQVTPPPLPPTLHDERMINNSGGVDRSSEAARSTDRGSTDERCGAVTVCIDPGSSSSSRTICPLLAPLARTSSTAAHSPQSPGQISDAPTQPDPSPHSDSQPLLGGGGGRHGSARILPQLPSSCPQLYAALVAECLNPFPVRRPTIAAVCRRLLQLAFEHVPGMAAGSPVEGSADGSVALDAFDEDLARCVMRRPGFAERAGPICEEEIV